MSRATIEHLKKTLTTDPKYKRFEPILDWSFSISDSQLEPSMKELCSQETLDFAGVLESGCDISAISELRDALKTLTEEDVTTSCVAEAPRMGWRQLAKCNSDTLCDNADLAKSALLQEREAGLFDVLSF